MKNCVLYDPRKGLHVLDVRLKQLLPDLTCNIKKLSISDNFTIFVHIRLVKKKVLNTNTFSITYIVKSISQYC